MVRAADPRWQPGRVLRAIGATQCQVQADVDRTIYDCTIRRLLRTVSRQQRSTVVAGDRVLFSPMDGQRGVVERVEPRQGVLARGHQYREHILVANITQAAIVASVDEPPLKPALIDRYLISAAKGGVTAAIVLNKADLAPLADLQPVIGLYSRLGYRVFPTSTRTGLGVPQLRDWLTGQQTVLSGQSGVGKSTLLNAIEAGLALRTGQVSETTHKGRHTTRYAQLLELSFGGWVVDTPGIRQFDLWDVSRGEIEGFFPEFRAFVPWCKYPGCLHLEEADCAVKEAMRDDRIALSRYESYLRLMLGDE